MVSGATCKWGCLIPMSQPWVPWCMSSMAIGKIHIEDLASTFAGWNFVLKILQLWERRLLVIYSWGQWRARARKFVLQQFVPYLVYRCKQKVYASVMELFYTKNVQCIEEARDRQYVCTLISRSTVKESSVSEVFGNQDSLAVIKNPIFADHRSHSRISVRSGCNSPVSWTWVNTTEVKSPFMSSKSLSVASEVIAQAFFFLVTVPEFYIIWKGPRQGTYGAYKGIVTVLASSSLMPSKLFMHTLWIGGTSFHVVIWIKEGEFRPLTQPDSNVFP